MKRQGNFKRALIPRTMFGELEVYENMVKEDEAKEHHKELIFTGYSSTLACEVNHKT